MKSLRKVLLALSFGLSGCIDWESLGIQPDASLNQNSEVDARVSPDRETDITMNDAGMLLCYNNTFNDDLDLEDLVIQNGTWLRDSDQYLKQTEATPIPVGYRMSYFDNIARSNLDATVKVRVPNEFTGDAHTGLLFRYTRNSQFGYDSSVDKGYFLGIEKGTGSTFDLTLEDAYISRIHTVQVSGSFDTWHNLRVTAIGNTITAYFNGEEIFSIQNSLYNMGHVGFGSHASVSHFDDLEVCGTE